jgi:hypothetical protein
MELRHLRYFVAVGEEQHYGRGAQRLRVAQPALSRQIQALEDEPGFKLFERLPRGVKISAAGKSFLVDARRILHEVNEAAARAKRVASGQSGTLRVGFAESVPWHGVVPDSFREFRERQPDAELQFKPLSSLELDLAKLSSLLLVLAQKSSRLMTSDSLDVSPASLTMVTALFLPKGGLARTMLYSPCFPARASLVTTGKSKVAEPSRLRAAEGSRQKQASVAAVPGGAGEGEMQNAEGGRAASPWWLFSLAFSGFLSLPKRRA